MPESYFEDADIDIAAQPKGGAGVTPYSGPVKLSFMKGSPAKEIHSQTVTATDGTFATVKWKAPAVAKTEEFYDLDVLCAYKDVNKLLLQATIWPKSATILINDEADKPRAACPFLVKQTGVDDQKLTTDGTGKSGITLLARAPYSIVMATSFTILEDKQKTAGQFRDHVLKVEHAIKAKFVTPQVDVDPYKADAAAAPAKIQLINLKSANPAGAETGGCDARGSEVVFTVTADPPDTGKRGDKIYFEIIFGRESKRNLPLPALSAALPVLGKTVVDKTTKGYVVLTADAGKASFEVNLGIAGGDTCTVKIGGTAAASDAELKLINWRKIYAQITKTAALTAPSLDLAKAGFKKVFIDFEEATADAVTVDEATAPAGSIVDGTILKTGLPAKSLVVGIHNVGPFKAHLKPRFASESLPCAHLIYCNVQIDAKAPFDSSTIVLGKKTGQVQGMVAFPAGGNVPGVALPGTLAGGSALFFALDMIDGSDAVKLCKWQEVGGAGNGDITAADYKIDHASHGNTLFVRLPAAAKVLSDGGASIKVLYQVAFSAGWYNGWCTGAGRHLVVAVGRPDKDICGTIIHEVGHAIAQTAQDAAQFPGLTAPPHGRFYTNNRGHQGGHCADGIDDATYNDASKKLDTAYAGSKCTCIMYGGGTDVRNQTLAFCAKCEPYAKATPVATVST